MNLQNKKLFYDLKRK